MAASSVGYLYTLFQRERCEHFVKRRRIRALARTVQGRCGRSETQDFEPRSIGKRIQLRSLGHALVEQCDRQTGRKGVAGADRVGELDLRRHNRHRRMPPCDRAPRLRRRV
jgi:hypothetical protein